MSALAGGGGGRRGQGWFRAWGGGGSLKWGLWLARTFGRVRGLGTRGGVCSGLRGAGDASVPVDLVRRWPWVVAIGSPLGDEGHAGLDQVQSGEGEFGEGGGVAGLGGDAARAVGPLQSVYAGRVVFG